MTRVIGVSLLAILGFSAPARAEEPRTELRLPKLEASATRLFETGWSSLVEVAMSRLHAVSELTQLAAEESASPSEAPPIWLADAPSAPEARPLRVGPCELGPREVRVASTGASDGRGDEAVLPALAIALP